MDPFKNRILEAVETGLRNAFDLDDFDDMLDNTSDNIPVDTDIVLRKDTKSHVKKLDKEIEIADIQRSADIKSALVDELSVTTLGPGYDFCKSQDQRNVYKGYIQMGTYLNLDNFLKSHNWYALSSTNIFDNITDDMKYNGNGTLPNDLISFIVNYRNRPEYQYVKQLYISPSLGLACARYNKDSAGRHNLVYVEFFATGVKIYENHYIESESKDMEKFKKDLIKYKVVKRNMLLNDYRQFGMIFDYDENNSPYCYTDWLLSAGAKAKMPDLLSKLCNFEDGILLNENFKAVDNGYISIDKKLICMHTSEISETNNTYNIHRLIIKYVN